MRWLADECVDAALESQLRGAGHDILYVAEVPSGATDAEVLRRARNDSRLLLTEDKDFGELLFRLKLAVPGVVLLRLRPEQHRLKWARLEAAIEQFGDKLFGRYVVIENTRLRSRPLLRSVRGSRQ
jgi:predicted nuclease of predicted toxin-antitoxin system